MLRKLTKVWLLGLVVLLAGTAIAIATVTQSDNLRVTVSSLIQPFRLPRATPAPIAVFLAGHIATLDGSVPPQLEKMQVKINRHGLLQSKGLPICQIGEIQPASTERSLKNCGDALVGSGQFWASIIFPGQNPYPTHGRLLIFNGREHGKPVLLAHIFSSNPFADSFVITFSTREISHGPYGTELTAYLPGALGSWGFVNRIKLTLRRDYQYKGQRLGYFNADCPAPKGVRSAVYPIALAQFSFAGGRTLSSRVSKTCGVRGP